MAYTGKSQRRGGQSGEFTPVRNLSGLPVDPRARLARETPAE